MRIRKYGTIENIPPAEKRAFFLSRVKKEHNGCWIWQGERVTKGYGKFGKVLAHRFSYEQFVAPIPEHVFVLHNCDNPPCVNPYHLSVGTCAQNARDAANKKRFPWQKVPMSEKTVEEIKTLRRDGWKLLAIASKFGISESGVCRIVKGSRWLTSPP